MARPFRFDPPQLSGDELVRPAVQRVLSGRFDRRVTQLIAGAGFGKTTALCQAFEQNRLRPLGEDRWLACDDDDRDPEHFAAALSALVGAPDAIPASQIVDVVNEWVGARSPTAVCIVLDDVHLLGDGATALVDALIETMPGNGRMVLAARRRPEVSTTRLELIEQGVTIDEELLAFDAAESQAVLGDAVPDVDLGGWPALVALASQGLAKRFVAEEILGELDESALQLLRRLVVLGEASEIVLDVTGDPARSALLESLPLVRRRGDRWAPHDLWRDMVGELPADVEAQIRRDASTAAATSGNAVEALDIAVALAGHDDETVDRALALVMCDPDLAAPASLRRWDRVLRNAQATSTVEPSPVRRLLRGIALRLDEPFGDECVAELRAAADSMLTGDDGRLTVAALEPLIAVYSSRRDIDGMLWGFGELGRLADAGVVSARPYPVLAQVLLANAAGDASAVRRLTSELLAMPLGKELGSSAWWMHAMALVNLGFDATDAAERWRDVGGSVPGMHSIWTSARWRAGAIRDLIGEPTAVPDTDRDRFLEAAWMVPVYAGIGDLDRARAQLDLVHRLSADAEEFQGNWTVLAPTAALVYNERRDDEAAELLSEFLDAVPADGRGAYLRLLIVGLIYPMFPDERAWFVEQLSDSTWGPLYTRDIELVVAAIAAHEGDPSAAATVDLPADAGQLMPSLGTRHGALLLAAAAGMGRDDLGDLLDDFVDLLGDHARNEWRRLLEHPVRQVAAGAGSIIEALPVRPAGARGLHLLGSTELTVDGVGVEHADWRRERVRALLTYLVLHPDTNRETVIAALWPDADTTAGRRNLRTTLNTLHGVLEPNRQPGDAPYFVRSTGQRLRLVVGARSDGLEVDVQRFLDLLDDADRHERDGTVSLSIEPRLEAVALYRGDLLPDCFDDWAVFERDRLRSRYLAGATRAAEVLIALDRPDEAVDAVIPALVAEPWSEPAHRALIAAHMARGDVAAARRAAATADRVLAEVGGVGEAATLEIVRRLGDR